MIVDVAGGWAVALSSATWALSFAVIGWWAARLPLDRVQRAGPVTRLRPWERGGALWRRLLRVDRWKDRVPEAGALFGGDSKRHLRSRTTEALARYRAETIRAERVHWLSAATTPVHAVWCRPTVFAGMVAFGIAANVPFVVIQRVNRGRLDRLLARRGAADPG